MKKIITIILTTATVATYVALENKISTRLYKWDLHRRLKKDGIECKIT